MTEPLVSVIVPAYNAEATLGRCLDSLLRQTWRNLEIIVTDDGSTDGTADVLRTYAARDARVRPVFERNAGVSAARNAALKVCRGDFIRFADSDDQVPLDSTERMLRRALETGADLVVGPWIEIVGPKHTTRALIREDTVMTGDAFLLRMLPHTNSFYYGVLWNKLFRRECLNGLSFQSGLTYGEDCVFVSDAMPRVNTVACLAEPVYHYIRNTGSMTVRQALSCVLHPVINIRTKLNQYRGVCSAYRARGLYEANKRALRGYLFRFTLGE